MDEDTKIIFNSLKELIKLKLLAKYSDKYNKLLTNHCNLIINKLQSSNDENLKLLELNCYALKASIEFFDNPRSTLNEDEVITGTKASMNNFLSQINEHLNYFQIDPESLDDYPDIRLNEIVYLNCQTLNYTFNNNELETDIQFFNRLIKHTCLILYEILVPRSKHQLKLVYDVLQQSNTKCLKYLLEKKIEALQKYSTSSYETKEIENLQELHEQLLEQVDLYLTAQ